MDAGCRTRSCANKRVRRVLDQPLDQLPGVGGVKTTHITTGFNAGRIIKDADTLLGLLRSLGITRAIGLPPKIGAAARRRFVKGVTTKQGASWIGDVADPEARATAAAPNRGHVVEPMSAVAGQPTRPGADADAPSLARTLDLVGEVLTQRPGCATRVRA